jgi:hypothetical protein
MSGGKDEQIHEDQPNCDDRPAASRHVLVLDWDNHAEASLLGLRQRFVVPQSRIKVSSSISFIHHAHVGVCD